jgi:hypothetical protein
MLPREQSPRLRRQTPNRSILAEVDVLDQATTATVVGAGFGFEHDPPYFQRNGA